MALEFREIKPREVDNVAEMTVSAFNSYYPKYSHTTIKREITSLATEILTLTNLGVSKFYVLKQDEDLIGSVGLTLYDNACYLNSMIIDPARQKQGLGTILLRHICDEVHNKGYGNIYLYANQSGKRLYEKGGFSTSFEVVPLKINYVKPSSISIFDGVEFNFEVPDWVRDIEIKRFGSSRVKLFEYLISLEVDFLTLGDKAYCTLRGHTVGNLYAETPDYAQALLQGAWKLGGEYFNSIENDVLTPIQDNISYTKIEDMRFTRMILGEEKGNFENYYGILSFGFG